MTRIEGRPGNAEATNEPTKVRANHNASLLSVADIDPDADNLTAAMAYVRDGHAVFPVKPDGSKAPNTRHGMDDATTDRDTIRRRLWWVKHPDSHIGVRPAPDEAVIDVEGPDGDHEVNGLPTFAELLDKLGPLDGHPVAETPSGGLHIWGTHDLAADQIAGFPTPGIDVKTHSGYAVAPPAPGRRWREPLQGKPPRFPDAWQRWMRKPVWQPKTNEQKASGSHGDDAYVDAAVDDELDELAHTPKSGGRHGGRNKALYAKAARLDELGVQRDWARQHLLNACNHNGVLAADGETQCNKTIDSAFGKVGGNGSYIPRAPSRNSKRDSMTGRNSGNPENRQSAGEKPKAESNDQASEAGRIITLRKASGITDGVPDWAWMLFDKGRLMRGTMNLFGGRPSAGKSTAARFFAAGYSNGTIGGCFEGSPQNVAYIAAEESIKYMVKPSLRAHNADQDRILFPEVYFDGQQIRLQSMRDEQLLLEQLIKHDVSIVFVDPIMSTIGASVDIYRSNETRAHVEPWQRIAEKINGLVIGIVHLRKQFGNDILAAINGSSAFGEIARGVIAFAADETGEERVLSQEKNSAGDRDLAMCYRIQSTTVQTDEGPAEVGQFVLGQLSERRASDLLRADSADERLGAVSIDVLEAVREIGGPTGASQVAALVEGLDVDMAGKYLRRLAKADMLVIRGRGLFDLPNRKT